jgi:transposase
VAKIWKAKHEKNAEDDIYFIFDNASIHKPEPLAETLEKISPYYHAHFLPPYSSRLKPIEQLWNEWKAPAKEAELMSVAQLQACISETFHKIKNLHTRNYFDHMVRVEHVKAKNMDDMH